jgi:hypothetical protein
MDVRIRWRVASSVTLKQDREVRVSEGRLGFGCGW